MRWKFVQRGYWVHGVTTFRDYMRSAQEFTMQAPEVDTVLVAVGGGGLIGGMAAYRAGPT